MSGGINGSCGGNVRKVKERKNERELHDKLVDV